MGPRLGPWDADVFLSVVNEIYFKTANLREGVVLLPVRASRLASGIDLADPKESARADHNHNSTEVMHE